jgi:Tfp pilus assembly protein PilF
MALYCRARGKHQEAIDYCTKVVNTTSESDAAVYYLIRGCEYCKIGQHQNAINDLNNFLSTYMCKPLLEKTLGTTLSAKAYNWRGFAYHSLGQYQKAIDDCCKRINLRPRDAMAYQQRGNFFGWLGEYQKAVDDCTTAINIRPSLTEAYITRATAYRWLQRHDLAARDEEIAGKFGYKPSKGIT